jgi:hypothetical protein
MQLPEILFLTRCFFQISGKIGKRSGLRWWDIEETVLASRAVVTRKGLYLAALKKYDFPHFTLLNILSLTDMKYCGYIPNDAGKKLAFLYKIQYRIQTPVHSQSLKEQQAKTG